MSRGRQKHKQERKRRHSRQIAEGTRKPKENLKRVMIWGPVRKRVKLSELNRNDVQRVLELVKNLDLNP